MVRLATGRPWGGTHRLGRWRLRRLIRMGVRRMELRGMGGWGQGCSEPHPRLLPPMLPICILRFSSALPVAVCCLLMRWRNLQEPMEAGSQYGEEYRISEGESGMKRTFPREEPDRLIASLISYLKENGTAEEQVENVNKEEQRRTALVNQVPALESTPSNGQLSDAQRWREEPTKARQEQKSNLWLDGSGEGNGTLTGAGTSEAGDIVAVDVARAYMGERLTRVVTPARVTLTGAKVATPLRLAPYRPSPYLLRKQQGTSISTQYESASVPTPFGLPAPGGVRNRDGGSYKNLRTPPVSRTVGRLLPVARTNAPSSAIGHPLSGEGSKKRGSAVLEDGRYSSGGPIRRLRPRSSLYTLSPASELQRRGGLGMYPPRPGRSQTPMDVKQKSFTIWSRNVDTEKKSNVINAQQQEETRGSTMRANASVPEQASATARMILGTLNMMTPSPKEKSLDTELALVKERPPTELTTNMINDKARQTMQSWDFPGPQDLEEAGPSGRGCNLENDLSSAAGYLWKRAEQGTKVRGKGKAPASTPSQTFEEKNTDHPPFSFQDTARLKVSESSLANLSPAFGRNKGFQTNADVDESMEAGSQHGTPPTPKPFPTSSNTSPGTDGNGAGTIFRVPRWTSSGDAGDVRRVRRPAPRGQLNLTKEIFSVSLTGRGVRLEKAMEPILKLESEVQVFQSLSPKERQIYGSNHVGWGLGFYHGYQPIVDRAYIRRWSIDDHG